MPSGSNVLDWQISVFNSVVKSRRLCVLVGFLYDEIIEKYSDLEFFVVPNWEETTALDTFLRAPFRDTEPVIVTYGDTVFHAATLESFAAISAEVVIGVDSLWESRFLGRSSADKGIAEVIDIEDGDRVEFTGLMMLSGHVVGQLRDVDPSEIGTTLPDLIGYLGSEGFTITYHDVKGDWAELNEPGDMAHFVLGTKAETLSRIGQVMKLSHVADQVTCRWEEWSASPGPVTDHIRQSMGNVPLIVRSSSAQEDGWSSANAGIFDSFLNVPGDDDAALGAAVDGVFRSYPQLTADSQVLIQPFLQDVLISGVVFTCDLDTGAPYYVINFDDRSGLTDSVTSGAGSDLRVIILHHSGDDGIEEIEPRLTGLVQAVREIQQLLGFNKLDIEFAIDTSLNVHIFQVRPIVVSHHGFDLDDQTIDRHIQRAKESYRRWQNPAPQILGSDTLFSNMADWNPAEIIGTRPNPLSLSLYRHIITDDIWARQRAEFGYRDVRPAPLVHDFCGQPYVDVRASLNSFLPAALPNDTAGRVAQAYLDYLRDKPHLHDKIEFDVALTIWTPEFRSQARERLESRSVSHTDIGALETALKQLTCKALTRLEADTAGIATLERRFAALKAANLALPEKIHALIEDCRNLGTLSFAHAARAGFVATALLRGLSAVGAITEDRRNAYLNSIRTVAGDFEGDLAAGVPRAELIAKYGHLRPGTYDITKRAYWENPEVFFSHRDAAPGTSVADGTFRLDQSEAKAIRKILEEMGSDLSAEQLFNYVRQAIQAREFTKFQFTRNLSLALDLIWKYGKSVGITRGDVAFLDWADLSRLRLGSSDPDELKQRIAQRKAEMGSRMVKLPQVILSERDFVCFEQMTSVPNFVTRNIVVAPVAALTNDLGRVHSGKIVLIPNADPGYDWLFGQNIAGLITQYGGANSHMAIRAAETSLPAAIGVGDKLFERICAMSVVELDCANQTIRSINNA